jgi:polysaccharide pyruvyl transferase WcaK-like protein
MRLAAGMPSMSKKEKSKIGLVTPYSGSNLGDGAIQEAVIENLRARLPDAAFCLFTLNPPRTAALHGVPSLPITGFFVSFYSDTLTQPPSNGTSHGSRRRFLGGLSSRLKNHSGLRRLLRPSWLFAKGVIATPFNIAREVRHVAKMYFLLREFKLLIVSGGGQIDDYWGGAMGHPYALLKWALLAKAAGVRLVFLSIGVCVLESRLSVLFARRALKLADYRSYRDLGSKQLLAGMKFTHADRVMPDLAFSYPSTVASADVVSNERKSERKIGISPIAYLRKDHWPKTDVTVFDRYVENLTLFIGVLLSKGHEVVLFATEGADQKVTELLMSRLEGDHPGNMRTKLRAAHVSCVRELLAEVTELDCVVASRLHGVILSHLCVKPVLAISYDRKVTQYMEEMEQGEYCLDIHGFRAEELSKSFDRLLSLEDAAKATIRRKIQRYREQLMSQYDDVAHGTPREIRAPNLPSANPIKEL